MCLYSKNRFPRISFKNIKCYKIVYKNNHSGNYFTPFQNTHVDDKVINGKEKMIPNTNKLFIPASGNKEITYNSYIISDGYIHTYREMCDAIGIKNRLNDTNFNPELMYEVYECVIPRFTLYYTGNNKDYASKKIKFVKKIK